MSHILGVARVRVSVKGRVRLRHHAVRHVLGVARGRVRVRVRVRLRHHAVRHVLGVARVRIIGRALPGCYLGI